MKLHIGCGKRDFGKEWIHIDGADYPHIVHRDITNLPYPDNSVDLIYACHVLSYFDAEEVVPLLEEWNRVLTPGGMLRVSVPYFAQLLLIYQRSMKLNDILGPLFGKMQMNGKTIYHKTTYDWNSLCSLLEKTGFKNSRLYKFSETEHSAFDDHSKAHYPHDQKAIASGKFDNHIPVSLNIECIK